MTKESIAIYINCLLWGFVINANLCLAYKSVVPELRYYTKDYYKLVKSRCPGKARDLTNMYSIDFIDNSKEYIGVCMWRYNGYKIFINREWWNKAIEPEKRQLMYHELAHCVINKMHINDRQHYMYSYFTPLFYEDYIKQVVSDIDVWCSK